MYSTGKTAKIESQNTFVCERAIFGGFTVKKVSFFTINVKFKVILSSKSGGGDVCTGHPPTQKKWGIHPPPPRDLRQCLQAVPSPPTAGLLRQARTQSVRPAPLQPARVPVRRVQTYRSAPETPFHARARLRSPTFPRSTRSRAPILHFAVAHTYQNVG